MPQPRPCYDDYLQPAAERTGLTPCPTRWTQVTAVSTPVMPGLTKRSAWLHRSGKSACTNCWE